MLFRVVHHFFLMVFRTIAATIMPKAMYSKVLYIFMYVGSTNWWLVAAKTGWWQFAATIVKTGANMPSVDTGG